MAKFFGVVLTTVLLTLAAAMIASIPTTVIAQDTRNADPRNEIKPLSYEMREFVHFQKVRLKTRELKENQERIKENEKRLWQWKRKLAGRKAGVKQLEDGFFSQLKFYPNADGVFPGSKGRYDISDRVRYLWDDYYGEFIRYKAERGEETYTLNELGKWLLPKEKKYIQQVEARIPHVSKALNEFRRREIKLSKELQKLKGHAALKDKRIRKEDIEKNKNKPDETNKARKEDRRRPPKPKAGEDRVVEADEGGMLTGKALKLADLEGCGLFSRSNDIMLGFASTPCPGLTGGRVPTQADYQAYCNSFDYDGPCGPPGPGTERISAYSGVYGAPLSVFCLMLHYDILSDSDDYTAITRRGKLGSVVKYNNGSRKLECFYLSNAQLKALYEQYKNIAKDPGPARPVAEAKPKKVCKPGGGLLGAMNCVTERIEGAGGSGAKTASAPPNYADPTDKSDQSPASASSTDPETGITTTSVRNPDGSRTVTKTDKAGNILSRETVGNSPDSASATVQKTQVTTRSVANPDGSRTVTTTDKDGNILSREKVR